jgi:transcription factor E2F3
MKRRNACEEEQDGEMNGWNGYVNSELSPAPTPSGPRMRGSRPKNVKQTKNGPQTPGPSGIGKAWSLWKCPVRFMVCRLCLAVGPVCRVGVPRCLCRSLDL